MPTFEQEVINRLQTQLGQLVGNLTAKDIQIEILMTERDAANRIITALGGELPVSQISRGGNDVSRTDQDTGAQGGGEAAGSPREARSEVETTRRKGTARSGNRPPDVTD